MKRKRLGAFNTFVWRKKIGYFTFYGAQYIILMKYEHSTEKLCMIASLATLILNSYFVPGVKIQNYGTH